MMQRPLDAQTVGIYSAKETLQLFAIAALTHEQGYPSSRWDFGACWLMDPPINWWAIIGCPSGTESIR